MEGTFFLLPPGHRLFVVFDDAGQGRAALNEAAASGLTQKMHGCFPVKMV